MTKKAFETRMTDQKRAFEDKIEQPKTTLQQEQLKNTRIKFNILKDDILEITNQSKYYQENVLCLQKKQKYSISKIKALKNNRIYINKNLEIIANTKPYRIAYTLRRFSIEFLRGNKNDKKEFLKWIFSKLTRKESGLEFKYNPIMELIKK